MWSYMLNCYQGGGEYKYSGILGKQTQLKTILMKKSNERKWNMNKTHNEYT